MTSACDPPPGKAAAHVDELGDDGVLAVDVDGVDVVLVRGADGRVHALADRCSHADFPLSDGGCDGTALECVAHGARFDIRTGAPLCLPAVSPVATYRVTVDAGGRVFVDVAARPDDV